MTSTDLTIPGTAPAAVSLIQQTAIELGSAHQIAQAICATSFVPQHFRGKPDECAVAILYGATVGFDPMTAIQQIYVISGKPALYARAMVAIVLAKGHAIWTDEEEPGRVVVAGRRKGSDKVERVEWSSALAQQAGYTSNAKYRTDPRSMLYARASGDIARRIAPDALLGMAYNVEELELGEVPNISTFPAERSGTGRLRAAVTPPADTARGEAVAARANDAGDVHDADVVDEQPDVIEPNGAQMKALQASFNEAGFESRDRAGRLAFASEAIGRDLSSAKDLTKAEASRVIDALKEVTPAADVERPAPSQADVDAAWGLADEGQPA